MTQTMGLRSKAVHRQDRGGTCCADRLEKKIAVLELHPRAPLSLPLKAQLIASLAADGNDEARCVSWRRRFVEGPDESESSASLWTLWTPRAHFRKEYEIKYIFENDLYSTIYNCE